MEIKTAYLCEILQVWNCKKVLCKFNYEKIKNTLAYKFIKLCWTKMKSKVQYDWTSADNTTLNNLQIQLKVLRVNFY